MKNLAQQVNIVPALVASNWAVGPVTGIKIDATGFRRARFVFTVGANDGTTAALSTNLGIWQASTSGDTFGSISSAKLAAVTSGVLSNNVMVIDTLTSSGTPWLLISGGSNLSTAIIMGATCTLYQGVTDPPTASAQQTVTVN